MAPFQYDRYRDPYVGTAAELMLRRGDIEAQRALHVGDVQARATEQQGQLWGGAIHALGQIPGQILDSREQGRRVAAQDHLTGLRIENEQAQIAHAKQEAVEDQQLRAVFAEGEPPPELVYRIVGPVRGAALLKGLAALKVENQHAYDSQQTLIRDVLAGMDAAPEPLRASIYPAVRQNLITRRLVTPEDVPEEYDPAWFAAARNYGKEPGKPQAPAVLKPGEQGFDPVTHQAIPGMSVSATPEKPPAPPGPFTLGPGDVRFSPEGAKIASVPKPPPAGADDVTTLTPAGLDVAALNFKKTGTLPPLGMGDKTTRKNIINRAATLTADDVARIEAGGMDIAGNKAAFQANAASLTGLQKQRDAIGAFEQTAQKNINIFLEAAGKVVDTGSPLSNSVARMVSGRMLGSPNQAAYDAARQVAINEIAKITSNPTLSGTLSDSARHEVDAFNPQSATLKQTVAVMRLLKQDMQNRTTALDEQIAATKARIGKGTTAAPANDPLGLFGPKKP